MAVLPDFDALGLERGMMFEEAKPFQTRSDATAAGLTVEERFVPRAGRRAGDALRAVEWSEITARLNAARDLRLLLRHESQAPIETVAASFGDAAASYFALLDDSEPAVNHDALGQSKASDAKHGASNANRPEKTRGPHSDEPRGDARDRQ